jgi:hypothetical protein
LACSSLTSMSFQWFIEIGRASDTWKDITLTTIYRVLFGFDCLCVFWVTSLT